jgi:hypothetical protein
MVSAREDRGLTRRSSPVASEAFLDRVRDLPAMLFPHAEEAMPSAQAATQRLERVIEAADRTEQSLAAMQSALQRAHRRSLFFGLAACAVAAISLGVVAAGKAHLAGDAVPQAVAAAPQAVAPQAVAAAAAAPAPTAVPGPLPVPPLPAATHDAGAAQPASSNTVLADDTDEPHPIEANTENVSSLLRSLPPGSIIVSPLPEPPAVETQPNPPVQAVPVASSAAVISPRPRHHPIARRVVYVRPPLLLAQVVGNLGRDIRSLFH